MDSDTRILWMVGMVITKRVSVTGHYINSRPSVQAWMAEVVRILGMVGMVIIDCLTFMCYLILIVKAIHKMGEVLLVPPLRLRLCQTGFRS